MKKYFLFVLAFILLFPALVYAKDEDFYFDVITDTHLIREKDDSFRPYPSTEKIVDYIIKDRPDFVIHVGDMIQTSYGKKEPDEAIYDMWKKFDNSVYLPFKKANIDMFVTKGNHDILWEARPIYNKIWAERKFTKDIEGSPLSYYTFEHKQCFFIVMDGSGVWISDKQRTWLKEQIKKGAKYRAVFVISHLGINGSKRHPEDHMDKVAIDILSSAPYKITLISGHHHKYDVCNHTKNLKNIVVGTAGSDVNAMWVKFHVKGKNVEFTPMWLSEMEQE